MDLFNFGARQYDPFTGSWITQDIYRGEQNNPQSLHRYMYNYDSPINYLDPYGYCSNADNISAGCPGWMPDWTFDTGQAAGQFLQGVGDVTVKPAVDSLALYAKYDCGYFYGACIPRTKEGEDALIRDSRAFVETIGTTLNKYATDPGGSISSDSQKVINYVKGQPFRAAGNVVGIWGMSKLLSCESEPAAGNAAKSSQIATSATKFNSVADLIAGAGKLEKLTDDASQGFVKGNGDDIFNSLIRGAQKNQNGTFTLPDGTILFKHFSTTTGDFTIDVNTGGTIYKIRVTP